LKYDINRNFLPICSIPFKGKNIYGNYLSDFTDNLNWLDSCRNLGGNFPAEFQSRQTQREVDKSFKSQILK